MPVFNERPRVGTALRRVLKRASEQHIIVVDDGSTDGTGDALDEFACPPHVELLFHDNNRGKGAAIRTALEHAVGQFIIIQDADLEYAPEDFGKLLEPLLSEEADVVYGSRYLNSENGFAGRRRFDWGVKLLNLAVRLIYGVTITDEATCYKVFPTSLLRSMDLRCKRFEFCPEVTAKACRLGLRIKEVPIRYSPRSIEEGKKIRMRDGIQALWTLWKYRKWEGHWDRDVGEDRAVPESQQGTNTVRVR
ncbi:MAG: glycosyltransferase family 2 protein [Planctomycetota bacterium]|nr:glycosyltransferase family 2 protein [Planctomycetota bacterium]